VSNDFARPNTSAVLSISPALYVRLHSQQYRKPYALDVWGGAGFAPVAFAVAAFDSDATAAQRLSGTSAAGAQKVVSQRLGSKQVVTQQSINVPIELGATFFLTRGVGIDLNVAFTFWIPRQLCFHDSNDRFCVTDGLKLQKSLFIGGGLSFLP
jgi:hypothetical protein